MNLDELNPMPFLKPAWFQRSQASSLNPWHGNYRLGDCLRSQVTQTCHEQLVEETAQCCLHISWTPEPVTLAFARSLAHSFSLTLTPLCSCCLLCSHHVWSAATRRLARLKVSGRRADVQIVLIPSTKVFLNSGSPSETMNNARVCLWHACASTPCRPSLWKRQQCPHLAHRSTARLVCPGAWNRYELEICQCGWI